MDGQDPSDRLYQVGVGLGSPEISCNDQFGDPGIAPAVIGEISVVFGSRCTFEDDAPVVTSFFHVLRRNRQERL